MTNCWTYDGYITPDGYGRLSSKSGGTTTTRLVHRIAYEEMVGPIPDGMQLDHLCRNRACYNPTHLEPVTNKVNLSRGRDARDAWSKHGTKSKYGLGCRCDACRSAHAIYARNYRARMAVV